MYFLTISVDCLENIWKLILTLCFNDVRLTEFVPHIEKLFDESVLIGSGWTTYESLRYAVNLYIYLLGQTYHIDPPTIAGSTITATNDDNDRYKP